MSEAVGRDAIALTFISTLDLGLVGVGSYNENQILFVSLTSSVI